MSIASPEGSALRPRGAPSARNKWYPRFPGWPPSEMLSHGALLALWITLSVLQVSGEKGLGMIDAPPPPRTESILLPASRAELLGGKE